MVSGKAVLVYLADLLASKITWEEGAVRSLH